MVGKVLHNRIICNYRSLCHYNWSWKAAPNSHRSIASNKHLSLQAILSVLDGWLPYKIGMVVNVAKEYYETAQVCWCTILLGFSHHFRSPITVRMVVHILSISGTGGEWLNKVNIFTTGLLSINEHPLSTQVQYSPSKLLYWHRSMQQLKHC